MTVESDLLISILKLTKEEPVSFENIKNHVRFPSIVVEKLLQKLQNDGLVYVKNKVVEVTTSQRIQMAVYALAKGGDIDQVSNLLRWKEFEEMAAIAFEKNGYSVVKNLHFKHDGRRNEIDVVGYRKPLVVCVDCKHWHHSIGSSTMERIVNKQVTRASALADCLPCLKANFTIQSWKTARFVPVVLSLVRFKSKFYSGVPIVSILQMQDFLDQLPVYAESMTCIDLGQRQQTDL